jgi:uncharacterized iron-regulated membrane protein
VRVVATVFGIVGVVLGAVLLVASVGFMSDSANDLGLGTVGQVVVGVYGGILGLVMSAGGILLITRRNEFASLLRPPG